MIGGRGVGFVLFVSIGISGAASVLLHAALGPGGVPCCRLGVLGDTLAPVVVGLVVGLPVALTVGRVRDRGVRESASRGCPNCGSDVLDGWRLCPECGYILDGDGG